MGWRSRRGGDGTAKGSAIAPGHTAASGRPRCCAAIVDAGGPHMEGSQKRRHATALCRGRSCT
eukprot:4820841-Prymnesium_polylepis.2